MSELIARYDGVRDLTVIDVVSGVPQVFHDGEVRDARTVRIGRAGLTEILHVAAYVPAARGTYYEYEYEADGGTDVVRELHPVIAWRIQNETVTAMVLNANGIEEAHEETTGNHRFVGCRFSHPEPVSAPEGT